MKMVFVAPVRLYWVQYAALGLSAASAVMGFSGSKKAEKEAKRAAKLQAAVQKQQYQMQKEDIAASQDEARHKAKLDIHDTTVAFMQQRAAVVAGAGEAGVTGGSIVRTLVDKNRTQSDVVGRTMYALEKFNEQADRDKRGAALGLQASRQEYKGASTASLAISAGLGFASQALQIGTNRDGEWTGYKW